MLTQQLKKSITEICDILKHVEKKYVDKIPYKFYDFLEKNKLVTYKPKLDYSKKLNEMELRNETKYILAIIYSKYWCEKY